MMSLVALLCPFVVLAVIITIVILIVRSFGRGGANVTPGSPRPPASVATQLAQDGFWLSSIEAGSVVYYQFWAGGVKRDGQIAFQPGNDGRQFVYTGMQPTNVEIVRVVGPSGGIVSGPVYVEDDTPDIMAPIVGGIAAQSVADALNAQPESPTPPQFPSAY